ncbi:AraC family ligand binding domain-containing protein [Ructibacterium gallinarum]|uniref:AraC family ligand binding domain-containing protein n=1 Tax=Ructibacterium gallinarum TaxID=2779355 RepID=A0A9D5M618_9FIRM|nr:AraC family ligand binding domain-containing protein [Ructibacterium gallinarum]MBE5041255.1 AraC family ligand binding domain-containing protein [Ructibacterium gallinarum]
MKFNEYALPDIKIFHSASPSGKRSYREHHHTECELSVILSGSGIYSIKDKEYTLQKGDIFLFGSNEIHYITDIFPGNNFELINIQFEPKFLWNDGDPSTMVLLGLFLTAAQALPIA